MFPSGCPWPFWSFAVSLQLTIGHFSQGTTLSPSPSLALITLSAFACVKGVGNVVTGPVSSALLTTEIHRDEYGLGRFKNIILYSGLCMLAGAAVMVGWWLWTKVVKWVERREESCGCVR